MDGIAPDGFCQATPRALPSASRRAHEALSSLSSNEVTQPRALLSPGRRYASHRRAELASLHGGEISAGVGAMVESAGELLASARYWSARSIAEGDPDFARLAATLTAGSRQAERDAWEIAAREAAARREHASQPRSLLAAAQADDELRR